MLKLPRRLQGEAHNEPHRTTQKQRSRASLIALPAQVWPMHGQHQRHLGAHEKCRCLGPHPQTCWVRLGILTISRGFWCASKLVENQSFPQGPQQAWLVVRIPRKAQNIPRPHQQLTDSESPWVAQGLVPSPNILLESLPHTHLDSDCQDSTLFHHISMRLSSHQPILSFKHMSW